jgi:ABC-type antimicrobial peptide transport system permease subunit
VLNGVLVVSHTNFLERFPSSAGYRRFLIDAPPDRIDEVAAALTRKLADSGFSVERSEVLLNRVNAVENTYLGIFQALGGLGLLLGSVGLALVLGRNVLERRAELALLGAVGFPRRRIGRLVTVEHAVLLLLGLLAGVLASLISLVPALLSPHARILTAGTAAVLAGLLLGGLLFTRLAAGVVLRGSLLGNLRSE